MDAAVERQDLPGNVEHGHLAVSIRAPYATLSLPSTMSDDLTHVVSDFMQVQA
jgi:hypothetical protein